VSIYSVNLGFGSFTDNDTFNVLYTVPIGGGPAIVRSVCIFASAGTYVGLQIVDADGDGINILTLDNTESETAAQGIYEMYQPLAPGWSIRIANTGSVENYSAVVGGYQFANP
jgi:hypothetical protein